MLSAALSDSKTQRHGPSGVIHFARPRKAAEAGTTPSSKRRQRLERERVRSKDQESPARRTMSAPATLQTKAAARAKRVIAEGTEMRARDPRLTQATHPPGQKQSRAFALPTPIARER